MSDLVGSIGLAWFLFGLIVLLLWILMPFAVFGIKDRLDKLRAETERTNVLLTQVVNALNSLDQPNWPK